MDLNTILAACFRPGTTLIVYGFFYMLMFRMGFLPHKTRKCFGAIVTNLLLPITIFVNFAEKMSFEEFERSFWIMVFIAVTVFIGFCYSFIIRAFAGFPDNFKNVFTIMCMFPDHVINPLIVTDAICRTTERWEFDDCYSRFEAIIWLQAPIFYVGLVVSVDGTMEPEFKVANLAKNPCLIASILGLIVGMIKPVSEFVTENIWVNDFYGPFRQLGLMSVPIILFLSYGKLMENIVQLFSTETSEALQESEEDLDEAERIKQIATRDENQEVEGREEGDESNEEITLNHVTIAFAALVLYGWAKFAVIWFFTDDDDQLKIVMLSAALMPTAVTLIVLVLKYDEDAASAILFSVMMQVALNIFVISGAIILISEFILEE